MNEPASAPNTGIEHNLDTVKDSQQASEPIIGCNAVKHQAIGITPNAVKPTLDQDLLKQARAKAKQNKRAIIEWIKARLKAGYTYCCPSCKHKVTAEQNYTYNKELRANRWCCRHCGSNKIKPILRRKDYADQLLTDSSGKVVSYTKHKKSYQVAPDGNIIKTEKDVTLPKLTIHRRHFDNKLLYTREELLQLIEAHGNPFAEHPLKALMYASFFAVMYITGARISELLGVVSGKRYIIEPVKVGQVMFENIPNKNLARDEEFLLIKNMPILPRGTLKKLQHNEAEPISYNHTAVVNCERDADFVKFIKRYLIAYRNHIKQQKGTSFKDSDYLEAPLFPFSISRGEQIFFRHLGMYVNVLRRMRESDYAKLGMSKIQIASLIGFNEKMSHQYSHITLEDNINLLQG